MASLVMLCAVCAVVWWLLAGAAASADALDRAGCAAWHILTDTYDPLDERVVWLEAYRALNARHIITNDGLYDITAVSTADHTIRVRRVALTMSDEPWF